MSGTEQAREAATGSYGSYLRLDDFVGQVEQTLRNVRTVLEEAGGRPEHLVRLTWFVRDKRDYINSLMAIGSVYREIIRRHYPAMTVVEVSAMMEDDAKVEIEATAVLPLE